MRYIIGLVAMIVTASPACGRGTRSTASTLTSPSSLTNSSQRAGVEAISIAGTSTLSPGSRVQLRSFARLADGSQEDVTAKALWNTDTPSVATVEPEGWVTGKGKGSSRISARFEDTETQVVITVSGDSIANPSAEASGSTSTPNSSSTPAPTPNTTPSPCLPTPLPSDPPSPIPCPFPLPDL
jgi:hypothetical protein